MADRFGSFAIHLLSVKPNSLLAREVFLLAHKLMRKIEQPHGLSLGRHYVVEKSQMVLKQIHRRRIVDRLIPDKLLVEDGRHWRHILVAESNVGANEACIAGLHGFNADSIL